MPITREQFLNQKRDYSNYVIHLTKRTVTEEAWQVLLRILGTGSIEARDHHFSFMHWLDQVPQQFRNSFRAVCLTECPIEFIDQLVERVVGRDVLLEPCGISFKKSYVQRFGGPVTYVTATTLPAYQNLWNTLRDAQRWGLMTQIMPYVNNLNVAYDFHWEREWRVPGGLPLSPEESLFLLCPEPNIDQLRAAIAADPALAGWQRIPVVDATWRPEKLVERIVGQLR